jgi:hypothetical protein
MEMRVHNSHDLRGQLFLVKEIVSASPGDCWHTPSARPNMRVLLGFYYSTECE